MIFPTQLSEFTKITQLWKYFEINYKKNSYFFFHLKMNDMLFLSVTHQCNLRRTKVSKLYLCTVIIIVYLCIKTRKWWNVYTTKVQKVYLFSFVQLMPEELNKLITSKNIYSILNKVDSDRSKPALSDKIFYNFKFERISNYSFSWQLW